MFNLSWQSQKRDLIRFLNRGYNSYSYEAKPCIEVAYHDKTVLDYVDKHFLELIKHIEETTPSERRILSHMCSVRYETLNKEVAEIRRGIKECKKK